MEARERFMGRLQDPEYAMRVAEECAKDVETDVIENDPDPSKRANSARHRNKMRARKKLALLPTTTNEVTSDRIRSVVALRFQQKSDRAIEDELGLYRGCIHEMERRYYEAFDSAQAFQMKVALDIYARNMMINKASLSEAGIIAINALKEVAGAPESGARNRVDASRTILNLVDMTPTTRSDGTARVAEAFKDTIQAVMSKEHQEKTSYVVDAEFEEEEIDND